MTLDPRYRAANTQIGRRRFVVSAGATLLGLAACGRSTETARDRSPARSLQLRPAGPDLALPSGFEYVVLTSTEDGEMPHAPDGMAAFGLPDGTVRLVRNHELADPPDVALPLDPASSYDTTANGGTTTLVLAPDLRTVTSSHVSLSGTLRNCAGGITPEGTWLSCEETNEGVEAGRARSHGYVFEVDARSDAPSAVTPLTALGRFLHEAVSVDPSSGMVYLTEDNGYDSGLYRFTPEVPGRLAEGGALEMLGVAGQPGYDTAFDQRRGVRLAATWVAIGEPDPATAGTDSSAVFNQGLDQGGARFKRAEGCCIVGSTWYVSITEGGDAGLGQVWAYDIEASEMHLVLESTTPAELFRPDNLSPAPVGGGVLLAEDSGNGEPNRLHLMAADGTLLTFAENVADDTEFAGLCSSPDGSTVFANIYGDERNGIPGRTLAIWGPWDSLG